MKDNFLLFAIVITVLLATPYIIRKVLSKRTLSRIDNRYYTVRRNTEEKEQRAANILAELNQRNLQLINHLKNTDNGPFQFNVELLAERYNPDVLSENIFKIDTSFTINKGESMEFCLDNRNEKSPEFIDINTLSYVLLHEDAHMMSLTIGHTPEFAKNFRFLTQKAVELGIYKYIDYSKQNENFCGIELKHSILN